MATTFVDIANAALTRLGQPIISSFQDGTVTANACSLRYQACRDIVLRMHPWTCATQRVILAPSATSPAFDYAYQFPLPADFIREVDISNIPFDSQSFLGPRPRYKIESGNILFDYNALYLRYVQQVQNATQFDPLCSEAISLYLAFDLSRLLLNNENLTMALNKEFTSSLAEARNVNAQENQTSCMVVDHFERARLRNGWVGGTWCDAGVG